MPISLRIFQFVVIHTVKGFGTVNKTEVDVLCTAPTKIRTDNSGLSYEFVTTDRNYGCTHSYV